MYDLDHNLVTHDSQHKENRALDSNQGSSGSGYDNKNAVNIIVSKNTPLIYLPNGVTYNAAES